MKEEEWMNETKKNEIIERRRMNEWNKKNEIIDRRRLNELMEQIIERRRMNEWMEQKWRMK